MEKKREEERCRKEERKRNRTDIDDLLVVGWRSRWNGGFGLHQSPQWNVSCLGGLDVFSTWTWCFYLLRRQESQLAGGQRPQARGT